MLIYNFRNMYQNKKDTIGSILQKTQIFSGVIKQTTLLLLLLVVV